MQSSQHEGKERPLYTPPGLRKVTLSSFRTDRGANPCTGDSGTRAGNAPQASGAYSALAGVSSPFGQNARGESQLSAKFIGIIDDSATVRKIVETALSREGYVVKGFNDGVEAMWWFAQSQSPLPELLFVDIVLPKMDGYEVIQRFKAKPQFAHTIFVILSRRDGVIERLKARLVGAKEYITKPFQTQHLLTIVRTYIGNATGNDSSAEH